jgi:iron complex outermembrane recepter protein
MIITYTQSPHCLSSQKKFSFYCIFFRTLLSLAGDSVSLILLVSLLLYNDNVYADSLKERVVEKKKIAFPHSKKKKALSSKELSLDGQKDTTIVTEILIKGARVQNLPLDTSNSSSLLTRNDLQTRFSPHLEDSLQLIPNLNWASGTSRPRFFQIRGIGELEQYEGAPNPSVGVFIDDIDFSGIGGVVTLFDIERLEVFRGPQVARYGSNALAGLVALFSKEPTREYSGEATLTKGTADTIAGGVALGGPINQNDSSLLFRLSAYHHYNNGFRHNAFLNRENTNKRDEFTTRLKLLYNPTTSFKAELASIYVNNNNGYDAFSIDNTLTTQSDRPGKDLQGSGGASLKMTWNLQNDVELMSLTSWSNSAIRFNFDGDWGNNEFWGANAPYDFFFDTSRSRYLFSEEVRISSSDKNYSHGETVRWYSGVFGRKLNESAHITESSNGAPFDVLSSDYTAYTGAAFGLVELPIVEGNSLSLSFRQERRVSDYNDSRPSDFNPAENMTGGSLLFDHDFSTNVRGYASATRGFRGGGFNSGASVPQDKRIFTPEYLWSYETGIKGNWFEQTVLGSLSFFYMKRDDQQVRLALQDNPADPLSFTYVTDNGAEGRNYGLESEWTWMPQRTLRINASGGLLFTEFTRVDTSLASLEGRDQSHAPNWQYTLSLREYLPIISERLFAEINIVGKDTFFFDDSNNEKSRPYNLINLVLGYEFSKFSWTLWGRNVFNEVYATRGFFFGNEPPDFPSKRYIQRGDPRTVGTSLTFRF